KYLVAGQKLVVIAHKSGGLIRGHAVVQHVLGSPGGSTIISTVFHGILNVLDHGMTPDQAAALVRYHHQLLPRDEIFFSTATELPAALLRELNAMGYDAHAHDWPFGDLQILLRDGDSWQGGSDPRGRGVWRVVNPDDNF
ncbi:MAG: gamma-glutamyltransferase, partial [Pseudomonadota bacterium]